MPSRDLAVQTEKRRTPKLVSVDGRSYPLRSAHIKARAEGGLASTTLVQEFANPYDDPLEVIYTMPLPADGAVLGYTIRMGEKVIRGEIEPREKAEVKYKKALFEGRTAGLLEQDRADTFMQRLGNLPPHTDVMVTIDVLQPLAFLAGSDEAEPVWEYRFPTVVSARYEGAADRVPDAERIDVDREGDGGIPTRFGLTFTVADDIPTTAAIVSKSHEIVGTANGVGTSVRLAENSRLDRDFVVQWPASTGDVGVRVVEGSGLDGDDGRYALLTVTPPRVTQSAYLRDLTVLIDASGSMDGMPLALAKRVVSYLLRSLEPGDRFEVLEFANATRHLTRGIEKATPEAVKRCIGAICAVSAGGGTEMAQAVEKALAPLRKESQRQIVLVSDGQIGFESEIFAKMGPRLPDGVRVHAVGIGSAPNRALTSGVARAGRGVELIAGDEASADEAARRLCAATVRPMLTDLKISGAALRAIAPARPRDVLAGQPLVLAAELRAEGGLLEVSGNLAGSKEVWMWRLHVPKMEPAATAGAEAGGQAAIRRTTLPIGALYGREAIVDVEMGLVLECHGSNRDLDTTIESLGMRHRITSRRTSLVAIADEPSVDPKAPRRRERLAVELPAGVSAEGIGLMGAGVTMMLDLSRGMEQGFLGVRLGAEKSAGMPHAAGAPARTFMARLLSLLTRPGGPIELPIGSGSLLNLDGPEVVIEFEVPIADFYLPAGDVTVLIPGWKGAKARVVQGKSSARGPHAWGLIVRLALRMENGAKWPEGEEAQLRWKLPTEMAGGSQRDAEFTLTFAISPAGYRAP